MSVSRPMGVQHSDPKRKEDEAGQAENQTVILERHGEAQDYAEQPTKVDHQIVDTDHHVAVSEGTFEKIFLSFPTEFKRLPF